MKNTPGLVIRQARRATFRQLIAPEPGLIEVLEGIKRVSGAGVEIELMAGQFAIMPDNLPLTVENMPSDAGRYRARAVMLGRANIEAAYEAAPPTGDRPALAPVALHDPTDALKECFERICDELQADTATPEPILDLRRQELAMRLAGAGAILGQAGNSGVSTRLRALVSTNPATAWSTASAAAALAMSEATLRRRLSGEETTFQALLADVRMTHALALLQKTDWTIATVAQEAGYDSPSRFAARFRERFGLNPAEIRRKTTTLIGPASKQIGTGALRYRLETIISVHQEQRRPPCSTGSHLPQRLPCSPAPPTRK